MKLIYSATQKSACKMHLKMNNWQSVVLKKKKQNHGVEAVCDGDSLYFGLNLRSTLVLFLFNF